MFTSNDKDTELVIHKLTHKGVLSSIALVCLEIETVVRKGTINITGGDHCCSTGYHPFYYLSTS